jgi:ribosomal protein L30E
MNIKFCKKLTKRPLPLEINMVKYSILGKTSRMVGVTHHKQLIIRINFRKDWHMKFQKVCTMAKVKTYYFKIFDEELTQIAATLFDNEHVQPQSDELKQITYYCTRQVYRLKWGDEIYYLKKFVTPFLIKKLKNVIRLSKAVASMRKAWGLMEHNFEVAEPVAALTYQKNLFHKESIYITKNYSGSSLKEFLLSDASIEAKKKALWDFSTLLGDFYKYGYFHRDPHLGTGIA